MASVSSKNRGLYFTCWKKNVHKTKFKKKKGKKKKATYKDLDTLTMLYSIHNKASCIQSLPRNLRLCFSLTDMDLDILHRSVYNQSFSCIKQMYSILPALGNFHSCFSQFFMLLQLLEEPG